MAPVFNNSKAYHYETPYSRKSLTIRKVEVEDYSKALDFFCQVFPRDEPTFKLLGYSEELADDLRRIVGPILDDGCSLLAEKEDDKKIVAVWITQRHSSETENFNSHTILVSHQARMYLKMVEEAGRRADYLTNLGTQDFLHMFGVCVDPGWRNQGIASEILKRALELYRKDTNSNCCHVHFHHVVVHCTNPDTRDIMNRKGFQRLGEPLDFHDFLNFDGEPEFKDKDLFREHFVSVYAKLICPKK